MELRSKISYFLEVLSHCYGMRLEYPTGGEKREFNSDARGTLEVTEYPFLPFSKEEKAIKEVMNV